MDKTGFLRTVAGDSENDETQLDLPIQHPRSVAVNRDGILFFADENNQIRKVHENSADGSMLVPVAGNGDFGSDGDGGPPLEASFFQLNKIAFTQIGDLLIVDELNHKIRSLDINGTIKTVAGNGEDGFSGDGGDACEAQINEPFSVAVDGENNIYIADYSNHRIRKVDMNGTISTIAGNGKSGFTLGDGNPLEAEIGRPCGICVGINKDIFISSGSRIFKLDSEGVLSNFAGNGGTGYTGDEGLATDAQIGKPGDLVTDSDGYLFFCDREHHVIRRIDPVGTISTVAGTGEKGFNGDGEGVKTQLSEPSGIALDRSGNLFVADFANHRLRKLCSVAANVAPNNSAAITQDKPEFEDYDLDALEKELLGEPMQNFASAGGGLLRAQTVPISKSSASSARHSMSNSIGGSPVPGQNDPSMTPPPYDELEGKGATPRMGYGNWAPGSPLEHKESEILYTQSFQEFIRRAPEGVAIKGSSSLLELFQQLKIDQKYLYPFVEHEIEVCDIVDLSNEDLQRLVPAIGPRNRLLKHIETLKDVPKENDENDIDKRLSEIEALQKHLALKEQEIKDREQAIKAQQQENLSLVKEDDDGVIRKNGKEYRLVELSNSEETCVEKCCIM